MTTQPRGADETIARPIYTNEQVKIHHDFSLSRLQKRGGFNNDDAVITALCHDLLLARTERDALLSSLDEVHRVDPELFDALRSGAIENAKMRERFNVLEAAIQSEIEAIRAIPLSRYIGPWRSDPELIARRLELVLADAAAHTTGADDNGICKECGETFYVESFSAGRCHGCNWRIAAASND